MIEVLVALAVLSIGLLGTAALQVQAKRSNFSSLERTTASMLINDLFERMQTNPGMLATYRTSLDSSLEIGKAEDSEPNPDCKADESDCSPAELAVRDVWEWEQALMGWAELDPGDDDSEDKSTGGLVLPLACVTGPVSGDSGFYTVAVNWRGHAEFLGGDVPDPCNAEASGRYDGDQGTGTLRRAVVITSYLHAD